MPEPAASGADDDGPSWRAVARLADLDPDYPLQIKIGRDEIALCIVGGQVFAVDNFCSHAFARLSDGDVEGFDINCPLHGGKFDLRTGEATASPCSVPIRSIPSRIAGEDVLILWAQPQAAPTHGVEERVGGQRLTREQMVDRGAYGFLTYGVERTIPIDKIETLMTSPACPAWGSYSGVAGPKAVEVKYSAESDVYLLFAGAELVEGVRRTGGAEILAFVEPDQGRT